MSRLLLYYTEHCHLCEEAEALLRAAGLGDVCTKVEIADDPALLELYETSIPVLKRAADGMALYWPFGARELDEFMAAGSTA